MQIRRVPLATLIAALLAVVLLAAPQVSRAGEGADGAKNDAKKKPHLFYRKTYEEALTEARVRNLPVFISRHKDF